MGNRTKREEISKLETACASLEKQLREKEFEVLCMFKMLGGQKYQVPADKVDYASQHYMHSKLDFQAEDAKAVAYAQHHYTHPSYQ